MCVGEGLLGGRRDGLHRGTLQLFLECWAEEAEPRTSGQHKEATGPAPWALKGTVPLTKAPVVASPPRSSVPLLSLLLVRFRGRRAS